MSDCIFCKIIKGDIPCTKVYEDEQVLAFLDIGPITRGHTLVMPKKHHASLFDLPEEDFAAMMRSVQKISAAVFKGVGATGLNLLQNNFRSAGQQVDHVHMHIVPRTEGDGFMTTWPTLPLTGEEMREIQQKIVEAFPF